MAKQELRENITLSISAKARSKLSRMKLKLRETGVARSIASESRIVDRLILNADIEDILRLFE